MFLRLSRSFFPDQGAVFLGISTIDGGAFGGYM